MKIGLFLINRKDLNAHATGYKNGGRPHNITLWVPDFVYKGLSSTGSSASQGAKMQEATAPYKHSHTCGKFSISSKPVENVFELMGEAKDATERINIRTGNG